MNKQKLVDLLKSPSNIDTKSLDEVAKIVGDNPYFQSGHALLAIGNKKFHLELAPKTVAKAAIYATNRILLKKYLDQNAIQEKVIGELKEEPKNEVLTKTEASDKNLTEAKSKGAKSKKRIIKEPTAKISSAKIPKSTKKTATTKSKKASNVDNPKEDSPPDPDLKKKEHKELIDKFIENEPSIKPKRQGDKESEQIVDLSTKNQVLTDDMVTENLANIMVRQGLLEKAIEVYNKLIWKFPHKKMYFVARIEELKEQ